MAKSTLTKSDAGATRTVFVTAGRFNGGTRDEAGKVTPFSAPAGTVLTEEVQAQLGLTEAGVRRALWRGSIVEQAVPEA